MLKNAIRIGLGTLTMMVVAGGAHAACTTETAKDDLTPEQIVELYECTKPAMRAGYAKSDNPWATEFTGWQAAFTVPGGVGNHGPRFLTTFVNATGFDEYVKYNDEGAKMPVGTVIAKESFNVTKKGQVKNGPLFFMEKVAAGDADEFGNWKYSALKPNGGVMKISQKFCHDCHGNFEDHDSLGYPEEENRLGYTE